MTFDISNTTHQITIDNKIYQTHVLRRTYLDNTATRIIIPVLMINNTGKEIVRVCIQSIRKFTNEDVEIWVVDNGSKEHNIKWLIKFDDKLNLVINQTEPVNPFSKKLSVVQKLGRLIKGNQLLSQQLQDGYYANAIGLELGRLSIDPATHTIFTMHSDILVTKEGWLKYLKSKLNEKVRLVGFRRDRTRVHAMHIAGLLLDFTLFEPLQMSFLPNIQQERYPDIPQYDVGDQLTLQVQKHGLEGYVVSNTFNDRELAEDIPVGSPFRQLTPCDLCFDDNRDVFYMHLGRGTQKSIGKYKHIPGKIYPEQWVAFADTYLLS